MSERNDGGPAFPLPVAVGPNNDVYCAADVSGGLGMSLRDYFAAQTLGYYIASMPNLATYDELAEKAYRAAAAMLKAREAKP